MSEIRREPRQESQDAPPDDPPRTGGAKFDGSEDYPPSPTVATIESDDRNALPDLADTSPIGSSKRVMKDRNSKTS
jgi:hypothetical protein